MEIVLTRAPESSDFRLKSIKNHSTPLILQGFYGLGRRCRRFESCHSDQKSAENEAFCPTFGCFFAYNRLLSTTSENSPDSRKAACASFTAQSTLFFRKAFSLTTAPQFLRADRHELYINRVWLQTPRNLTIWGVSRFLAFLQS